MRYLLVSLLLLAGCECIKPPHKVEVTIYRRTVDTANQMFSQEEVLSRQTIEVTDRQFEKMFGK